MLKVHACFNSSAYIQRQFGVCGAESSGRHLSVGCLQAQYSSTCSYTVCHDHLINEPLKIGAVLYGLMCFACRGLHMET